MSAPIVSDPIEAAVRRWLESVVIGLNLCPFAAQPYRSGRVRVVVSAAREDIGLLSELQAELQRLDETSTEQLETTIIVIPEMLTDFLEYNDFFQYVDALLEQQDWEGLVQVAGFHPHYQFADTEPGDRSNDTNRAPYPLLHLLREESVSRALLTYPNAEDIPARNIRRMESLSDVERSTLFPYLAETPSK